MKKELFILYILPTKIFLCSVEYFSDYISAFCCNHNTVNREQVSIINLTYTQTHLLWQDPASPSNTSLKAKNPQISGEFNICKHQEFWLGFHMNPKLLASLCMLVYQGTWFTVLSRMICIYKVSTVFCSHRNCLGEQLSN